MTRTWTRTGGNPAYDDMPAVDDFICNEDARLIKREGEGFLEYRVDGEVVDGSRLDELLSVPPALTDAERAMFDRVFGEADMASINHLRPFEDGARLFHKGLIRVAGQLATITPLGKTYRT
jgi:hypothetical protein